MTNVDEIIVLLAAQVIGFLVTLFAIFRKSAPKMIEQRLEAASAQIEREKLHNRELEARIKEREEDIDQRRALWRMVNDLNKKDEQKDTDLKELQGKFITLEERSIEQERQYLERLRRMQSDLDKANRSIAQLEQERETLKTERGELIKRVDELERLRQNADVETARKIEEATAPLKRELEQVRTQLLDKQREIDELRGQVGMNTAIALPSTDARAENASEPAA